MKLLPMLAVGLLCAVAAPTAALAGAETGFYLGAGAGMSSVGDLDSDLGNVSFDEDDFGWKAFGGFNFGWIPFLDLAVEGGYVNFGEPDKNALEVDVDGWDVFGVVGGKIGPIGLFGKAGVINWDADVSSTGGSASDDGTDPAYGVGLRFQIMSLQIRAEYEYFDVDSVDDVSLLSASVAWTF